MSRFLYHPAAPPAITTDIIHLTNNVAIKLAAAARFTSEA
jgi:hypothetical protein